MGGVVLVAVECRPASGSGIFGATFLAQASRCDEEPVVDFAVKFESQRQVAVWPNRGQISMGGVWLGSTTHARHPS